MTLTDANDWLQIVETKYGCKLMYELKHRIIDRLEQMFSFKTRGEWFREGVCPQCGKKELYTHAHNPRIVKCGRLVKCGYEEHVKDICEDLFKDWSKDFPKQKQTKCCSRCIFTPGRGLTYKVKGLYTQQFITTSNTGEVTATVRFELAPGIYWERFDRPERFGVKKQIYW
jgi:hypothetical protein